MKPPTLAMLFFITFLSSFSQITIAGTPAPSTSKSSLFQLAPEQITRSNAISDGVYLQLDPADLRKILSQRADEITIMLPISDNEEIEINLEKKNPFSSDFRVRRAEGSKRMETKYSQATCYQGKVKDFPNSLVAISFFEDKIMGVVSYNGDDYNLGVYTKGINQADDVYVFYPESNLLQQQIFNCHTSDDAIAIDSDMALSSDRAMTNNSVKIYFECDYKMYQDNGSSVQNTTDFVTGMFNVIAAVYAIDDICVELSEVFVWTTDDPYPSLGAEEALTAFGNQLNGSFNGDVAHLLSTATAGNGGLAYLDVICDNNIGIGYSNIDDYYLGLPNYSWTVAVVAHELGHNFGSPHTHSCSWAGGAIDNCFCPESSCDLGPEPAADGGTIMSYCHLTSGTFGGCTLPSENPGINLNAGFGQQPAALIYNNIENASCLTACGNQGGGGGTAVLDCDNAVELTDGVTYFGNTDNGSSNISLYSCNNYVEPGKEVVHFFTAPISGTANYIYNENVAGDIDLYILSSCDPSSCLTYYDGGVGITGTMEVVEGVGYYFVTDVYAGGNGGAYDLTINFPTAFPVITVIYTASQESCYGEADGSIDLNVSGGSEVYSFQWNTGGTMEQLVNLSPGDYSCTITDSNGASQTTELITINAAPLLNPLVQTPNALTCDMSQVFIDATATISSPGISSSWSTIAGNILTGGNTLLLLVDQPGTYTLTLMYDNDLNCVETASAIVEETAPPTATLSTSQANDQNADGLATVIASGGAAPYTYLWNTTPPQMTATATGLSAGSYTVLVEDANGCILEVAVEVGSLTKASELTGLTEFQLSPNPTNGYVNIALESEDSEEINLQILDVLGQVVWTKNNIRNQWQERIDLSALPNSVYMITVRKGTARSTKRLLLHR
ncbi:MAG: hypothetical protein ACI8YQ_003312 [Polaribacter sp.]|jgi:hypothetical protein